MPPNVPFPSEELNLGSGAKPGWPHLPNLVSWDRQDRTNNFMRRRAQGLQVSELALCSNTWFESYINQTEQNCTPSKLFKSYWLSKITPSSSQQQQQDWTVFGPVAGTAAMAHQLFCSALDRWLLWKYEIKRSSHKICPTSCWSVRFSLHFSGLWI